jgi:hypothetical protein
MVTTARLHTKLGQLDFLKIYPNLSRRYCFYGAKALRPLTIISVPDVSRRYCFYGAKALRPPTTISVPDVSRRYCFYGAKALRPPTTISVSSDSCCFVILILYGEEGNAQEMNVSERERGWQFLWNLVNRK